VVVAGLGKWQSPNPGCIPFAGDHFFLGFQTHWHADRAKFAPYIRGVTQKVQHLHTESPCISYEFSVSVSTSNSRRTVGYADRGPTDEISPKNST
jgi:hypothetical protein